MRFSFKKIEYLLITLVATLLLFTAVLVFDFSKNAAYVRAESDNFIVDGSKIVEYTGEDKDVVIPEIIGGTTVTEIGDSAFSGCDFIESITIPASIVKFEQDAFKNCENISKFYYEGSLEDYLDITFIKEYSNPLYYAHNLYINGELVSELEIPEGVEVIKPYAFIRCAINKLVLSESLKVIDTWAFGNCVLLKDVELNNGLESIGSAAFYYCTSLKHIDFPETLIEIKSHAFRDCSSLLNIIIPENVTTISNNAFYRCTSLSSIIFSGSTEDIGIEAFYDCSALLKVSFSNGLLSIGARAFSGCSKLDGVSLPDSLTAIGEGAFENCISLKSIIIPENLTELSSNVFNGCTGLLDVIFNENLITIGERAFTNCINLTEIFLPISLTEIETEAFSGCYNLYQITVDENVIIIESAAFNGCDKLFEIKNLSALNLQIGSEEYGKIALNALRVFGIDETSNFVLTDDGFLFYKDYSGATLFGYFGSDRKLSLPDAFEDGDYSIGTKAFLNNFNLREITLPICIKSIDVDAFKNCDSFRKVYFKGYEEDFEDIEVGSGNESFNNAEKIYLLSLEESIDKIKTDSAFVKFLHGIFKSFEKNIFAFNLILTIIWGVLFLYGKRKEINWNRRKIIFIIIVCTQWILISSLRADSVGADTENYLSFFDEHSKYNFKTILVYIYRNFIHSGYVPESMKFEPGIILLNKGISLISTNHVFYKFIIASLFMIPFGVYLYKNSDDPCLSFALYSSLFYNMFSLTGYRQVLSAIFAVFWGFKYIKERKLIKFLIVVLIGALFHKTALIMLLFYFLSNKKLTDIYIIICVTLVIAMILFRNQLFQIVKYIVGYEQYSGLYGFHQQTFVIMLTLLTIVAFALKKRVLNSSPSAVQLYNGLILSWFMMPFAMVSPTSMRLVYTFGFVIMLLVPKLVRIFEDGESVFIYIGIYSILFLQVLLTAVPYAFI